MALRILVLGGGFGGLYTALETHRRLGGRVQITVVDRTGSFLFTPLIYQVVSGILGVRHVSRPLSQLLPKAVKTVRASVLKVDLDARRVETDLGPMEYDLLVLALGSVPHYYGIPFAEQHALTFKWLPDAERLRAHIMARFAEAEALPHMSRALLKTVVVGAGCTGVELAAELHDWIYGTLLSRFPRADESAVSLDLVEAMSQMPCPADPELRKAAARQLLSRRLSIRLGTVVEAINRGHVRLRTNGNVYQEPYGTAVWAAGVRPSPIAATLPLERDPGGRIRVTETLQVPGRPEVLVVGDMAACPDPSGGVVPATAQAAFQEGPAAARTLAALVGGRTPPPFRYKRKGEVLHMGRSGAIGEVYGVRLTGLPAWLAWRTLNLLRLPDWGDRASVALEWAKDAIGVGG